MRTTCRHGRLSGRCSPCDRLRIASVARIGLANPTQPPRVEYCADHAIALHNRAHLMRSLSVAISWHECAAIVGSTKDRSVNKNQQLRLPKTLVGGVGQVEDHAVPHHGASRGRGLVGGAAQPVHGHTRPPSERYRPRAGRAASDRACICQDGVGAFHGDDEAENTHSTHRLPDSTNDCLSPARSFHQTADSITAHDGPPNWPCATHAICCRREINAASGWIAASRSVTTERPTSPRLISEKQTRTTGPASSSPSRPREFRHLQAQIAIPAESPGKVQMRIKDEHSNFDLKHRLDLHSKHQRKTNPSALRASSLVGFCPKTWWTDRTLH